MRSEPSNSDLLHQMGYEGRDVNIKSTLIAVFVLIGFFVFCMVAIAVLYGIFIPDWYRLGQQEPIPVNRRLPPYPQVQVDPRRDFELYRQAEDKELAGKGAAMSVDQAIDTIAKERGISGLRGDTLRERGTGYPGETSLTGAKPEAEKTTTGATTPAEAGQGATEPGGNR